MWAQELIDDEDRDFLLGGGINNGFKIVDLDQPEIKAEMHNYKLTDLHHDAVEALIKAEIAEHRYIITADKPKLVSALNVVT